MQRAWIEVDLGAIGHNLRALRRALGPRPEIMAVLKANAYGHGAAEVARSLSARGVGRFAVATFEEALRLRASGLAAPVLVMGPVFDDELDALLAPEAAGIELSLIDAETARRLSARARFPDRRIAVHLAVDTGMSRFGVAPEEAPALLAELRERRALEVVGLSTHFARGEDPAATAFQERRFEVLRGELEAAGLMPARSHLANSAGCILRDARGDDLVRPGIALYGVDPTGRFAEQGLSLRPALMVKSRVASLRAIEAGTPVGYGGRFVAERPSRIAIVPIGYGDGWAYQGARRGRALINGRSCPVIGTVMMDALAVDVTDLPETVQRGAEAVFLGRQGAAEIRAEELAEQQGTIPYDVLCRLGPRLERRLIGSEDEVFAEAA